MYYRNAAAAIVVYDITNEATFDILQEWIKELNRLGPPDIVLAIAGNKCDLEDKREVSLQSFPLPPPRVDPSKEVTTQLVLLLH